MPDGVTLKPHGFYSFDGAWSRYGEGPFPDVLPPPGNVGERCELPVRKPYGIYCYGNEWHRYGEGPFPSLQPPPDQPENRLHIMATEPPVEVEPTPARPSWLEVAIEIGHADVKDPKTRKQPSRSPDDLPRHEPLPGQTRFLDALEAKPAASPAAWGIKLRKKRKQPTAVQTFLFIGE